MAANSSEFETPDGVFLVENSFTGLDKKDIHVVQDSTRILFPGKTERDSLGLKLDPDKREVDLEPCDNVEVYRMGSSFLQRLYWMVSGWRFPSVLSEGLLVPKTCEGNRHYISAAQGETYGIGNIGQSLRRVRVSFVDPSQIPNLPSLDLLR